MKIEIVLADIIKNYGKDIFSEKKRLYGLISDFCPGIEHERERYLVKTIIELGITERLVERRPTKLEMRQMTQIIFDKRGVPCQIANEALGWFIFALWGLDSKTMRGNNVAQLQNSNLPNNNQTEIIQEFSPPEAFQQFETLNEKMVSLFDSIENENDALKSIFDIYAMSKKYDALAVTFKNFGVIVGEEDKITVDLKSGMITNTKLGEHATRLKANNKVWDVLDKSFNNWMIASMRCLDEFENYINRQPIRN